MLRFLTAGESHGASLVAILEGMVSNLSLSEKDIDPELLRRQEGIGRSERMNIERDHARIISGLRNGKTVGSPIAILIDNADHEERKEVLSKLRPGHADLAGSLKYNLKDVRGILERSSARETAARVAIGAIAKKFLGEFKISIKSKVISIGGSEDIKKWVSLIEKAKNDGDTLGGIFEVHIQNVPVGLGSHVQNDRKLDALLAQAMISIQAIKGVEFGMGFEAGKAFGSRAHDEIIYSNGKFSHKTNNAGGIEGGMSNGETIVIRAAMKPISTMKNPLKSVDLLTKQACEAHFERADICAVHAASVVAEAASAFVIADELLKKYGGDSIEEVKAHSAMI